MAEALRLSGDRDRGEYHYLRSFQTDPSYFWAVADLAVFYASSAETERMRRLKSEPYVRRLRDSFAHHKDQPRVLAKIERKLGQTSNGG